MLILILIDLAKLLALGAVGLILFIFVWTLIIIAYALVLKRTNPTER